MPAVSDTYLLHLQFTVVLTSEDSELSVPRELTAATEK